jgi:hypothetical protein
LEIQLSRGEGLNPINRFYICIAIGDHQEERVWIPLTGFISVLPLEIQLSRGEGLDPINRFYICIAIGDPVIKRRGFGSH